MRRTAFKAMALAGLLGLASTAWAQAPAPEVQGGQAPQAGQAPAGQRQAGPGPAGIVLPEALIPREWIDKTTGHRVRRISTENGSSSNYFNVNSYTPDGRWMAFSSPSGIMALDLQTFQTKLIIPGRVSLQFVGRKTGHVYYTVAIVQPQAPGAAPPPAAEPGRGRNQPRAIMAYDFATGQSRQIAVLQPGYSIATINADETLFAGSRENRGPSTPNLGGANGGASGNRDPASELLPNGQRATYAEGREVQINRRLVQNIPMEIFTIDVKTGARRTVTASTDWLGHLQFSPTDPNLLLYCHEGNWHVVDRLWLVNVRDKKPAPKLLHARTMNMEIAGHEWWSRDGKEVLYDLQTPRGEVFWIASYNVGNGKRNWYHMDRNSWGVHFNQSDDGSVFSSDGGDPEMAAHAPDGKYIYLLRPKAMPDIAGIRARNGDDLITAGTLVSEKLVDLNIHNYRSEPNASFTPDGKWLVFRSNMWGPGHVYAVEVAKAAPGSAPIGPSGTVPQ